MHAKRRKVVAVVASSAPGATIQNPEEDDLHVANDDEQKSGRMTAPTTDETLRWARALHAGQVDKSGAPYIEHVERVRANLRGLFPEADAEEEQAALLHDAMEDCGLTAADMRARFYSDRVIAIVEAVTRRKEDGLTYAAWIERLAASGNSGAIRVKIADMTDNADPARMALLPPDKARSLGRRYERGLNVLWAALDDCAVLPDR